MNDLTDFERAVLEKFLSGDHPTLETLRRQLSRTRVSKRHFTRVGFKADLTVEGETQAADGPIDFHLSDVHAEFPGLRYGAAFMLFVHHGYLARLEGATTTEAWPTDVEGFQLAFDRDPRDLKRLGRF